MSSRAENDAQRARIFGRVRDMRESGGQRDVADFRRIGLSEADAKRAALSLARGTYGSFREAGLARSMFGSSRVRFDLLNVVEQERAKLDSSTEGAR
ncbi:hypothetical protein [Aeromicrobium sp. CnD17-E]|uniref:hypothetical protein n=1 Tax=Aeromicrobium sp. CnD17-E TaxID=2954487 RepID=UPI0020970085|nr:hypothetical protein [Aeromicrobium sp. CnD17-E]MCO7238402.1 hypothetical protein [Aeromicrobium sp. CnD17-E]